MLYIFALWTHNVRKDGFCCFENLKKSFSESTKCLNDPKLHHIIYGHALPNYGNVIWRKKMADLCEKVIFINQSYT